MLRQRLRLRRSPLALLGRGLLVVICLALVWYGLMLLLLALKVSPEPINSVSGYRSAYDGLAGLSAEDVSAGKRLVAALVGLTAFLLFGYLALKELPRPYFARHDLRVAEDERGAVDVEPRAIERIAELAAGGGAGIGGARARYETDRLAVDLSVRRAREVPEALRGAQQRVRAALGDHDLPQLPVDVTLTGFDRKQRRELS